MPLEEREEVIAPAVVGWPVASVNVRLSKDVGHIADAHSAWQCGNGRLEQLGDLTQLLHVYKQAANLLHHHGRHGEDEWSWTLWDL